VITNVVSQFEEHAEGGSAFPRDTQRAIYAQPGYRLRREIGTVVSVRMLSLPTYGHTGNHAACIVMFQGILVSSNHTPQKNGMTIKACDPHLERHVDDVRVGCVHALYLAGRSHGPPTASLHVLMFIRSAAWPVVVFLYTFCLYTRPTQTSCAPNRDMKSATVTAA
jgi:hypothetical protein